MPALVEFVDEGDELAGAAAEPVEVKDDEDIAAAQVVEAGGEARAIRRGAGGVILEHALAAGGVQGVELPVEDLATFGGGDAGVAANTDEAHGMMCGVRSRKTPLRRILSQRDYFGVVGDIFRRNAGRGTYLGNVTTNT